MILRRQIDLRQTALLDEAITLAPASSPDEVKTLKYEPNAFELSTQSSTASLLVLSETYYPGWKAWLDDRPARIYPADIALRGILLPAGAHRIRMEFQPVILRIGLAISAATAIFLLFLGFGMRLVVYRH